MLKLYNTLTKNIEEFELLNPDFVTLYACGPTVYSYAHIGNFRTYVMTDLLVRTLKYLGYKVKFVTNVTDVGHLVSDADSGEDKMEKGARREGKTAWEVAKFYTKAFLDDSKKLNLLEPDARPRPTEHIPEQIAMVQILKEKEFAYQIDDGIYFDTSKLAGYGKLTGQNLEELKAGARVEVNPQKKNPLDFALWKFSYPKGRSFDVAQEASRRDMEWDSPFGKGFPGWHIECSAMSMKYLGNPIDIHTGGMDLIPIHHTNEIAQSETATGKSPFVRYWVHGQLILVDGEKMAKSKENFYRLADVEARGFEPLALRYLYLTAHYRAFLNFTWEAIESAQNSLNELRSAISNIKYSLEPTRDRKISNRKTLSSEKLENVDRLRKEFDEALGNDLNMPEALAVMWEVIKSNIPSADKLDLILDFDEVFALKLNQVEEVKEQRIKLPQAKISLATAVPLSGPTISLIDNRELARARGDFEKADEMRKQIEEREKVALEDTPQGPRVLPRPHHGRFR